MDALSEIIALLRPESQITAGIDVGGDWAIRFRGAPGVIKCHAVTAGGCWLLTDGAAAPTRLTEGDCLIAPHGRTFVLASDPTVAPIEAGELFAHARPGEVVRHGDGGGFALVGARFEVDGRKAGPLLRALPPIIHLHDAEDREATRWYIGRMMTEMRGDRPGGALAARHLAHLLLVQAFRLHLARQGTGRIGVLYALADPQLGRAIGAMHAEPARRWTLAELARLAGLSRSIFAARFRLRVGETPIAYLTGWRMMLARDRLAGGREPLGVIADALGYGSEAAFSTAFRRIVGEAPRRHARKAAPPTPIAASE